ncbi:MAG: hypothetical protein HC841_07965 [Verrucomicrobiae bacterium]|nr:hypothetical protein [Verrucomicrobiae bacterium]
MLALAEEHDARLVIIDERKGRRYAERLGFGFTGTVGILLLATMRRSAWERVARRMKRVE